MIFINSIKSLIIIVILILYMLVYSQPLYNEGFESFYSQGYCKDCNRYGWRGESDCMSCGNCGWCIDPNGNGSCVAGDAGGPHFADCVRYFYNGGIPSPVPQIGPMNPPWYQRYLIPWYGGPYWNQMYRRPMYPRRRRRRRVY